MKNPSISTVASQVQPGQIQQFLGVVVVGVGVVVGLGVGVVVGLGVGVVVGWGVVGVVGFIDVDEVGSGVS